MKSVSSMSFNKDLSLQVEHGYFVSRIVLQFAILEALEE